MRTLGLGVGVRFGVVACCVILAIGLVSSGVGRAEGEAVSPIEQARSLARLDNYLESLAADPLESWMLRRILDEAPSVGGLEVVIARVRERAGARRAPAGELLVLGQLLAAGGREAAALEAYREAEVRTPGRHEGPYLIGLLHQGARRVEDAFRAFDQAIAAAPRSVELRTRQTMIEGALSLAVEVRDVARAKSYAAALSATDPRDTSLMMKEAGILEGVGAIDEAVAKWRELEKRAGGNTEELVAVWKALAATLEGAGRAPEAVVVWRSALTRVPRNHRDRLTLWYGLAGAVRAGGDLEGLVSELEAEGDREPDVLIIRAGVLEELGRPEEALEVWRKAVDKLPRREDVRLGLMRALERVGDPAALLEAVEGLVKLSPREPRYQLQLVDVLMGQGDSARVPEVLRGLTRSFGDDPGLLQQVLGRWVRRSKPSDQKDIEAVFRRLMQAEPDEADHVLSYGSWLWSRDDKVAARAAWKRLEVMKPVRGRGHFEEAAVLFEHGDIEDALRVLNVALQKAPRDPEFLGLRARIAESQRKPTEALAAWREVARVAPVGSAAAEEAEAHTLDLWVSQRVLDQRIEALAQQTEKLVAAGDTSGQAAADGRLVLAGLLRLGRLEEAGAWLIVLEKTGTSERSLALVGEEVAARRGDFSDAAVQAERLAKAQPALAYQHLRRAAGYAIQAGDREGAQRLAREIVKANPGDAAAHRGAGEILVKLGDVPEAISAFERATALDPTDIELRFRVASFYQDQPSGIREGRVLIDIIRDARERRDVERAGLRLLEGGEKRWGPALYREFDELVRQRAESAGDDGPHLRLYVDVVIRAARILAEGDPRASTHEPSARVVTAALRSSDQGLRLSALELVRLTRTEGAVAALTFLARDSDAIAAGQAVALLGEIGSAPAIAFLETLYAGKDARLRDLALWAGGLSKNSTAFDFLERASRSAQRNDRVRAALALGVNPSRGAAVALSRLLVDTAAEVREAAAHASRRWLERYAADRAQDTAMLVSALTAAFETVTAGQGDIQAALLGALSLPLPFDLRERALRSIVTRLWQEPLLDGLIEGALGNMIGSESVKSDDRDRYASAYADLFDAGRGRLAPARFIQSTGSWAQNTTRLSEVGPELTGSAATLVQDRFAAVMRGEAMLPLTPSQTLTLSTLADHRSLIGRAVFGGMARGGSEGVVADLARIARLHPDPRARVDALASLARLPAGQRLAVDIVRRLLAGPRDAALAAIAVTLTAEPDEKIGSFLKGLVPEAVPPFVRASIAAAYIKHAPLDASGMERWLACNDPAVRRAVLAGLESADRASRGKSRDKLDDAIETLEARLVELGLGDDAGGALLAARLLASRGGAARRLGGSPWPSVRAVALDGPTDGPAL